MLVEPIPLLALERELVVAVRLSVLCTESACFLHLRLESILCNIVGLPRLAVQLLLLGLREVLLAVQPLEISRLLQLRQIVLWEHLILETVLSMEHLRDVVLSVVV